VLETAQIQQPAGRGARPRWIGGGHKLYLDDISQKRIGIDMRAPLNRLLAISLVAGCLFSTPALASDWTIVPSVGYGLTSLKFNRSTATQDQSSFNTLDLGFTAARKRFYLRINTEIPLTADYIYGSSFIRQVKREDVGLVAGYSLFNSLSVFTGISYGKTSIIDTQNTSPTAVYTQYIDSGPFLGTNYRRDIGKKSSISLNVAFALMGSSLLVKDNAGTVPIDDTGTTSGFSLGVSWNSRIHDKGSYFVSLRLKDYRSELNTLSVRKDISVLSFGFVFPM
jgi:hypothetical protein